MSNATCKMSDFSYGTNGEIAIQGATIQPSLVYVYKISSQPKHALVIKNKEFLESYGPVGA